jgi:serine protease
MTSSTFTGLPGRATLVLLLWLTATTTFAASVGNARRAPAMAAPTDRIIVKWRERGVAAVQIESLAGRAARLSSVTGIGLRGLRSIRSRLDVLRVDAPLDADSLQQYLARLRADPAVEYAEADERRYILAAPNDTRYYAGSDSRGQWQGQWYLGTPGTDTPAAIDAITAWDTTRADGIVIAVIDTGVQLDHPELAGKLLSGRDFVCNDNANLSCTAAGATLFVTANDGDGWDTDPSDPGDWISSADLARSDNFFAGCGDGDNHDEPVPSSWHGTRVAGLIAAITDNNAGIASVAPNTRIVPVRAIGKCAGYLSDLVAALYWAGGVDDSSIAALPSLTQRAHIVNVSLGGRSSCSQSEQAAVTALINNGVLIVAAAGNDGGPVGAPANCSGVLSVAGLRHIGTKVGYSNVSSSSAAISIAAPAGNCVNILATDPCLYSIETLSNEGDTIPTNAFYTYALFDPSYSGNKTNAASVGTSFSAPLAAGVAALMASLNGNLTTGEVIDRIRRAARPFPTPAVTPTGGTCHVAATTKDANGNYTDVQERDCQCTTATCGAGMLNAPAAIAEALRPIALLTTSVSSASIGQHITLDGSTSLAANGRHIVAWQWSVSPDISVANATSSSAEIVFPAFRDITVSLQVTDDAGRSDTASAVIQASAGSSSGGGALDPADLLLLLILLAVRLLPGSRLLARP